MDILGRLIRITGLALLLVGVGYGTSWAQVFHSRDSALALAFPGAAEIKPKNVFLSEAELAQCSKLARARCQDRVVRVYTGHDSSGALMGYAFIDTHSVRSLEETVMVVVAPSGRIHKAVLLAFHEPEDYMATPPWLAQFEGHTLSPQLALGRGVDVLSGATITSNVLTAAARRVLAVHRVKLSTSG